MAVNTTLHLRYDGYLCKGMIFQLKAAFHKALYVYYHVHSCFSKWELALCFPLSNSCNPVDQLNPHHVPSKRIFTDTKYLLPLKSYDDFISLFVLASTVKQTLEIKKTTGEH